MKNLREGGFLITKIRKLSQRIFSNLLKESNIQEITAAQGRVLFPLWKKNEMSFQELKKKTLLSKSTLSYMLDQLENAGYIKRIRSEDDKRLIDIKLTEIDENLKEKFIFVSNQMKDIYYKGFLENEIDEFEAYLKHVLDNLTLYSNKE